MTNEQIIAGFLQNAFTDERLAETLAHAEDGKLSWHSCCCLLGIPTAGHALQGSMINGVSELHYIKARALWGVAPDMAFGDLSTLRNFESADAERRAKLIPLLKAEIARRDRERTESVESESLPPALVTVGVNG